MISGKYISVALTAAVLLVGAVALASSALLWPSPAAGDLPVVVIEASAESSASSVTVAPAASSVNVAPAANGSTEVPPSGAVLGSGSQIATTDGGRRELVKPTVRDDDVDDLNDGDDAEPDDDLDDGDAAEPDDDTLDDDDAAEPDDD